MKEIKPQRIQEVQHVAVAVTGVVEFLGKEFEMTCPDGETWMWFHKGNSIPGSEDTLKRPYDDTTKGLYYCEHGTGTGTDTEKYYFYVQGRGERLLQTLSNAPTVSAVTSSTALFFLEVCDDCFELTAYEMMVAIVVDVLLTLLVMLITYKCSQKRSSAAASHTPKGCRKTHN